MLRKHKKYSKPRRRFEKERIKEEDEILKKYGLKNKKEVWKAESGVAKIREKAKNLISADAEKKEKFFDKLRKIGFNVKNISDVLALNKEDFLNRRFQTILVKKKLVTTPLAARQAIVHKKALINNKAMSSPSYIVPINLEDKISIKIKRKKIEKENAE